MGFARQSHLFRMLEFVLVFALCNFSFGLLLYLFMWAYAWPSANAWPSSRVTASRIVVIAAGITAASKSGGFTIETENALHELAGLWCAVIVVIYSPLYIFMHIIDALDLPLVVLDELWIIWFGNPILEEFDQRLEMSINLAQHI